MKNSHRNEIIKTSEIDKQDNALNFITKKRRNTKIKKVVLSKCFES